MGLPRLPLFFQGVEDARAPGGAAPSVPFVRHPLRRVKGHAAPNGMSSPGRFAANSFKKTLEHGKAPW
jgi:hypothetical protein